MTLCKEKGERSNAVRVRNTTCILKKRCMTDVTDVILMECLGLLVTMHQASNEDLSLKASRINLPSEHNSLILFTLKSWTSLNTDGLRQ